MLVLSIETHIYVHIQTCETAEDVWTTLQNLYEDKGLSRKIGLLRNLISTRLENCESMQQYIDQILCCSHKLTGIGFAMSDEWTGAILLAGLTDNFKPFIMGIEASEKQIATETIIAKLLDGQLNDNIKGEAFVAKKKFMR